MKLKYQDLDQVQLLSSDEVSLQSINRILEHLLANDIMLANPEGISPGIWECKWFNDSSISGYPEGYAVWYNTESPEQFIEFNCGKMYEYVKNNSSLASQISEYNYSNYDQYYSLLTGYQLPNRKTILSPLFDIGNLQNQAQIRISTISNNKHLPSDSRYWKDFILNDNYKKVEEVLNSQLQSIMKQHLEDYHFGNNILSGSIGQYLKKDMSNISSTHKWQSHNNSKETSGFDYVKIFVKQPFQQCYYGSVIKNEYDIVTWKINGHDSLVDSSGCLSKQSKANFIAQLSTCANFEEDGIQCAIENLTDKTIINIKYVSNASLYTVPFQTTNILDISGRNELYNCTYDVVPLTTSLSSMIQNNITAYEEEIEHIVDTYQNVKYKYYKWFRLWNSGYLEHGGIVPVDNIGTISVNFDWNYYDTRTMTAPIYDYPTTVDSFYGVHDKFMQNNSMKYNKNGNIGYKNRYSVSLTPIFQTLSATLTGTKMSYGNYDKNSNYVVKDVDTLKNNGFCIHVDDKTIPYYSYYVTGFKTNI